MTKKIFLYLILFVVVFVFALIGFLSKNDFKINNQNNEELTLNWQTYTNNEYGFSLKYPSDWERNYIGNDSMKSQTFYKISTTQSYPNKNKPLDAFVRVSILDNPDNLTIQEIFNKEYQECLDIPDNAMGCPAPEDTSKWQEIIIDGKKALRSGKRNVPEGLPEDVVYIIKPNYFIVLGGTYYNFNNTYDFSLIFEHMLDTFKINNQPVPSMKYINYSDEVINPFTSEVYLIRKESPYGEETYCGINGAAKCDLVKQKQRKDGSETIILSLFNRYDNEMEQYSGAYLVKFIDGDTLIIGSKFYDHGGGVEKICAIDVNTGEVNKLIEFSHLDDNDNNIYSIRRGDKELSFINMLDKTNSKFSSTGIFLKTNGELRGVDFDLDPYYQVEFEIVENYQSDEIEVVVNGNLYTFDFTNNILSPKKKTTLVKIKDDGRFQYYDGIITVSGEYREWYPETLLGGNLCFYVDDETGYLIPRASSLPENNGDNRTPWFCFKDQKKTKEIFGVDDDEIFSDESVNSISGQATIMISHYIVDRMESSVVDTAVLEKIISQEDYSIKYK